MLRSWNFLNRGDERITPILRHSELVSESSHRKTLGNTQKEKVVARSMGQMLKRVQHDKKRKVAFTLAEVLITLGIIGVVAALTLPTLISNYQKRVYVTQLKKSVSVLSQGFTTMMGHDGVTRLQDTEAFSNIKNVGGIFTCDYNNILNNKCRSIKEGLESIFSGIQFTPCNGAQIKYLNGSDASGYADRMSSAQTCIVFPDGSMIFNYAFYSGAPMGNRKSTIGGWVADINIDVNGPKNPNTFGRDIFSLILANNGVVYGTGSQTQAELNDPFGDQWQQNYWRTTQYASYKCTTDDSSAKGLTCAGRVLEEDAMNY